VEEAKMAEAGNINKRGRLSTIDVLNKIAFFIRKKKMLSLIKEADLN
jgi:hypothetical protein